MQYRPYQGSTPFCVDIRLLVRPRKKFPEDVKRYRKAKAESIKLLNELRPKVNRDDEDLRRSFPTEAERDAFAKVLEKAGLPDDTNLSRCEKGGSIALF